MNVSIYTLGCPSMHRWTVRDGECLGAGNGARRERVDRGRMEPPLAQDHDVGGERSGLPSARQNLKPQTPNPQMSYRNTYDL